MTGMAWSNVASVPWCFLIHQLAHMFQSHHLAARRQQRDVPAHPLERFAYLFWSNQSTSGQHGNNASCRTAFLCRQFLGGLEHVIVDIQGRPHQEVLMHRCI